MDLLVGLASLTVAMWLVQQWKMPFPSNVAALAFVALVIYTALYSLAAYTVNLLTSVTRMVSSVPVFLPLLMILVLVIGYCLGRKGLPGGRGPFNPF